MASDSTRTPRPPVSYTHLDVYKRQEGESRTVDMHIKSLRHKLGACGEIIRTVRGVGYKIGE